MRTARLRRLDTRLVASYMLLVVLALAVFTAGTGAILFHQMRSQLAHFAVQDIELMEGLMYFLPSGKLSVRDDYHNHSESKQILEQFLEVRGLDGAVLYRNDRLKSRSLGGPPLPDEGVGGYSERPVRLNDGTRVMVVSRRHSVDGKPTLIRLAHNEEPVWHALWQFLAAAGLMFPVMIGVAAILGYRMSRRMLAPVREIARRAEQITSSRLHERIRVNGTGDEIDQLAEVFNRTLGRLEQSFRQLRQFTSDASHELRTPLAAIRAIGEVGLARDGSCGDYRELVGSMLEEVNRLTRLVDDLLMISRGDSGAIHLHRTEVDVTRLAEETVSLLTPLAEEKQQQLVVTGKHSSLIQADAVFLRQALINILHNAIKYSPPGNEIFVDVQPNNTQDPGSVTISVRDAGPGIAPEHRTRIFDRFYRVDQGRSREAGGFGLGLAIANWAVEAHSGTIDLESDIGQGSTFRITVPAK